MKKLDTIDEENKELKIIAVQSCYTNNKEENLKKALEIIENCHEDTDCIVFPELYSTGYFLKNQYLDQNAESLEGSFITSIKEAAKLKKVAVCMPFLEKYEDKIYNAVAVINQFGELIGIKRKFINWKTELGFISESDMDCNLEVYQINDMKVGILTCYEACFPELARILADKEADVIIINAFWSRKALSHWLVQLRARALDNNIFVVGVNGIYKDKSCGHSMLVSPDGRIDCSLEYEEGILEATINKSELIELRDKIPYYKDYINYIK